jgi:serine protease inhibitor
MPSRAAKMPFPPLNRWLIVLLCFGLVSGNAAGQNKEAQSSFIASNTRFAFKLFRQVVSQGPDKNLLVAPTGLSLTFALLENGADAATREEIENGFEFKGLDLQQINEGAKALREALQLSKPVSMNAKKPLGMTTEQWHALQAAPPNGTIIADSLWLRTNLPESFLKISQDDYGVDIKRLLAAPTPTIQISRWATGRTGKTLSITPGPMSGNDLLFVDVTYFRKFWREHFPDSATKPGTFTMANGKTKQVPFMYRTDHFQYFEDEKFQAVTLPYDDQTAMLVFLPREDSTLKEFEQSLDAAHWQNWQSKFDSHEGTVGLPRIQLQTGFDVRAALKEIGVNRAFDTFAAFRPIVPLDGARLENAIQKTQLKVDESGTEAVSILMVGGVIGGVPGGQLGGPPPPPPFKMIMNRPFLFAIVDKPTGQLLFLGAVMEP